MNHVRTTMTLGCAVEFTQALDVLNRSIFEIEKMYCLNLRLLLVDDVLMAEIENNRATTCCALDENLVCICCTMFCNDDNDLNDCVKYCNLNYRSLSYNRWALQNCDINHISGKEPCLIFIPKDRPGFQVDSN
ncbi:hypothetical protein [Dysgonomonas sp. GY617]|uniref:hypothetical protein n=1 Tax=Dysgonomonas sp. GY617 TaxID=2780420 RepID=UPI0018835A4C|nr:hypothetical protein [Dysgonomonas sp. GY617]MBF0577191.1 hypothetical protein [Dysgonomonas sp. GY617]